MWKNQYGSKEHIHDTKKQNLNEAVRIYVVDVLEETAHFEPVIREKKFVYYWFANKSLGP